MKSRVMVAAVVMASAAVAIAWVFFVPILEAPDETVHFEYVTALYSAGGLVAPRDAARLTIPNGRPIPYPKYLEDQSAVAVIAEKPDVKAPAGYGAATYYDSVDRNLQPVGTSAQLFNPPLLRYYPFGYYLLDAAAMGVTSLFTSSPVALFFAARALSVALLVLSLVGTGGHLLVAEGDAMLAGCGLRGIRHRRSLPVWLRLRLGHEDRREEEDHGVAPCGRELACTNSTSITWVAA